MRPAWMSTTSPLPTAAQLEAQLAEAEVNTTSVGEVRNLRVALAAAQRRERGRTGLADNTGLPPNHAELRRLGWAPPPEPSPPLPSGGHWKTSLTSYGEERVWVPEGDE